MEPRIKYPKVSPALYTAMLAVEDQIHKSGLDEKLLHMLKLRASMINGCAYCIDMHWKDAREAGETEQRLYGLGAWRESPYYSDRERAALAWAEAITLITDGHAPDDVFEEVRAYFNEKEVVDLAWAVAAINAWNRMAIACRAEPGKYVPPKRSANQGQ